mmetsp:Transcript_23992/g.42295  ORF Transcript_23992/g.42295 Transcript_23992/m.42295 type:complete len:211 (-) Transcript_23992:142-774(-)
MGAAGSVPAGDKARHVAELEKKLEALKAAAAEEGIEDTPRGETAKAEVKKLRQLLKATIEDGLPLDKCLKDLQLGAAATSGASMSGSDAEESDEEDRRVACEKCGRKFNPDRIEKHQSVCKGPTPKKETPPIKKDDTSAADGASGEEPKWKKDREKMKEQLKRDMAASKNSSRSSAASEQPEGESQPDAAPSESAPAEAQAEAEAATAEQ